MSESTIYQRDPTWTAELSWVQGWISLASAPTWSLVLFGFEEQKYGNSDFQSHFSMSWIDGFFMNFFSLKNIAKGAQLFYWSIFIILILNVFHFIKVCPIFDLKKTKKNRRPRNFYTHQVGAEAEAKLIHPWTQLSSVVQVGSCYIMYTVFPHIVSAETILFLIWKSKGHST